MRVGTWLLAALLGATAASAFQLYRELDDERDRRSALEARVRDLEAAATAPGPAPAAPPPGAPPPSADASPVRPAGLPARPAVAVAVAPPGAAPSDDERSRMRAAQERQLRLWKDPEYRAAMIEQSKIGLRALYADAARELGLSAADFERLLGTLAEHRLPDPDAMTAPITLDGRPDEAQLRQRRDRAAERRRAQEASLRGLLGDEGFARWQDYERSLPERVQAQRVRYELASAGIALERGQELALGRLLLDEQRRMADDFAKSGAMPSANAATATPAGTPGFRPLDATPPPPEEALRRQRAMLEATERANQRIREAAAAILTPEQVTVFMQQREASLAAQKASLRMQESASRIDPYVNDSTR